MKSSRASGAPANGSPWSISASSLICDRCANRWPAAFRWRASIGRAKIMDAPEPGGIGGTYAGNPVACAAALGVFDAFEQEGLMEKAEARARRSWRG